MCLDFNFVLQPISDPSQTSVPNQVRTRAGLPQDESELHIIISPRDPWLPGYFSLTTILDLQ